MVLLWVVVEVFPFLEHSALQQIEQYVNVFLPIRFYFLYISVASLCYFPLAASSIS